MRFVGQRRLLGVSIVVFVLAAAAAMRPGEQPVQLFRVTLGIQDKEPADWSGQVAVSGGEVVELTGWRFEAKDALTGMSGWKCRTHNHIAPTERLPLVPASGKPAPAPEQPWPNGVTLALRGEAPVVTLTFANGKVEFPTAELHLGAPKDFLDGQVRIERLPVANVLRPPAPPRAENPVQDDYPAFWIRYRTGKHYLAWQAYQKEKDRVLLVERDGPNGEWSEPIEVAGPGDHFRVALASTRDDTLWIVWSSQREHNWNLYGRPYKDGKLGQEVRLTDSPGPNMWHRMTTDRKGRAWLVWQGIRDARSEIFARCADGDGWHGVLRVSDGGTNHWDPAIAADYKDERVWVGWDCYEPQKATYSVRVRSISGGPEVKLGEVLAPEDSSLFTAHISLACDRSGRLWTAWDESGPQWGKDTGYLYQKSPATGLYASRRIRVKCLSNGKWLQPAAEFKPDTLSELKEFVELPQLQDDGDGRIWLAFRHRTCWNPRTDNWAAQGRWDAFATPFLGDRWLPPIQLPRSGGGDDMRISSQRDREGHVYFAYATDNRGELPPNMGPRNQSISLCRLGDAPAAKDASLVEHKTAALAIALVHPREQEQVARIRRYKIETGGKTYRIYRGDLHRHTDISGDGMGDGTLMDLHRYARDAAALDFVLVADHNMGNDKEYSWWRTQKANDLYTVGGSFISLYGYERSVPYPNGHRNVIWIERGHRTLPLPQRALAAQMAADTSRLYAYLRRTNGICTLHTSATDQGTDWQEHDDALEPFVELFQGFHASYEAPGAPRIVDADSDRVHGPFKPDGYVSHALAKGYRLGFQASSDHVATHVSYACVLAEDFSRRGLVDAMLKRHTYAATDNIVLDVRAGAGGIMGDELRTADPRFEVAVRGTAVITRVDILRNGEVVHAEQPAKETEEVRFGWRDPAPLRDAKPSYYYVRVLQRDGQMAWSSPIWINGS